jgi:hypothetical protein
MISRLCTVWSGLVVGLGLGSLAILLAGCPDRSPVGTAPPTALTCAFADEGRADDPVLAIVLNGELRLVRGDRSSETIARFADGQTYTWMQNTVEERDGVVLATAQYSDADQFTGAMFEAVLMRADGTIVWHRPGDARWGQAFLGEAGVVALAQFGGDSLVVMPDGTEHALPSVHPVAPPLRDGTVAVRASAWSAGLSGWAHPGATEVVPLAFVPTSDPLSWRGQLVYIATDGTEQSLVVESPTGADELVLPTLPQDGGAYLMSVRPEGWAMVACAGYADPAFIRVNLITGEAERLTISLPEGMREFNISSWPSPMVDPEGAILLGLRDDFAGGLYRSFDGATWSRVGSTVSDVLAVEAENRAGTYLVLATNARYSWEEWLEPPEGQGADLVGDSLFAVRPSAGGVELLPATYDFWIARSPSAPTPLISPDGACVAYWEFPAKDFPRFWALDVVSGERLALGSAGATLDPFGLAWLPLPAR